MKFHVVGRKFFRVVHRFFHGKATVRKEGFTLVEVMVAFGLFAVLMGTMMGIVSHALRYRNNAGEMQRAIYYGRQKMAEIKTLMKTESAKGEIENAQGYSFDYEIKEEELDLAKLAEDFGGDESQVTSAKEKYFKESSQPSKSTTGMAFKMLHYKVNIHYGAKQTFTLDYYRGLGVF